MNFCLRCGKEFSRTDNLKRHLGNKTICKSKYLNIARESVIEKYNENFEQFMSIRVTKSDVLVTKSDVLVTKSDVLVTKSNVLLCQDCGKEYIKKNSLIAHRNRYCSYKKQKVLNERIIDLNTKLMELHDNNNLIKDKADEEKEYFKKEIEILKAKLNSLIPQNGNTNNGSIQNADTINNQNNVTINITNYGQEDLSHMTVADWEMIIGKEFDMIPCFVEYVHIDNEENRNIYVPSIKNAVAVVKRDGKWVRLDKNSFITKMLIDKRLQLQAAIDTHGDEFVHVSKNRAQNVLNYCNNDEVELKRIKGDTTLMLIDNKEIVKETLEKNSGKKITI